MKAKETVKNTKRKLAARAHSICKPVTKGSDRPKVIKKVEIDRALTTLQHISIMEGSIVSNNNTFQASPFS